MNIYRQNRKNKKIDKTQKLNMKRIKWILIFLAVLLASTIIFFASTQIYNTMKDEFTVAHVNNEGITFREFNHVMYGNRAITLNYFMQKYCVEDGKKFWSGIYGEENPLEKIKEDTLEELKRTKVIQALAKQYGLVEDVSYKKFLQDLKEENSRRKKDVENKKKIYGVKQYTEDTYYAINNSNLFYNVKEKMSGEIEITDEELNSYYAENKDKSFLKSGDISTKVIAVSYDESMKRENAEVGATEIKSKLNKGEPIEDVVRLYNKERLYKVELTEWLFKPENSRADSAKWPMVTNNVKKLEVGQTSDVIEDFGAFYIVKCTGKMPSTYIEFNAVKENIRKLLVEQKYDEIINKLVEEAKVEIDNKVYDMVEASDLIIPEQGKLLLHG